MVNFNVTSSLRISADFSDPCSCDLPKLGLRIERKGF
jgi:hypothetical protein